MQRAEARLRSFSTPFFCKREKFLKMTQILPPRASKGADGAQSRKIGAFCLIKPKAHVQRLFFILSLLSALLAAH